MTAVYIDDVLVTGRTPQQAHDNLIQVLERLQKAGLRLSLQRCSFLEPSCIYLGHKLGATGIHPTPEKLAAIQGAPRPSSVTELRSFLGMINYYHKFLRNLSSVLAPLHKLLQKGVSWQWGSQQQQAFEQAKLLLQSSQVLVHYNPDLPLVVSCDASPYGIGAVLSHIMPDGAIRPIAFASRSLTAAERNYAQLEREGLAVVFGITHFHKFLYGRTFRVFTNHKPLLGLLKEDKLISQMAGARIQRWALKLSNYQYSLCY